MLDNHGTFLTRDKEELAICGKYIPARDSVHVGIYWHIEGKKYIIDFNHGTEINYRDGSANVFFDYYFNPVPTFPGHLLPSFTSVAKAISLNRLNDFVLKLPVWFMMAVNLSLQTAISNLRAVQPRNTLIAEYL